MVSGVMRAGNLILYTNEAEDTVNLGSHTCCFGELCGFDCLEAGPLVALDPAFTPVVSIARQDRSCKL